jgi:hypothetical protein
LDTKINMIRPLNRKIRKKALEIIANKDNWTRYAYARDISSISVPFTSAVAQKFCIVGALRRAANIIMKDEIKAIHRVNDYFPVHSLTYINDYLGYDAVIKKVKSL